MHFQVHNSSVISSGGTTVPHYLSSGHITSSKCNVGSASLSASSNTNFHTFTSTPTNNVSSSPDLWSQQHLHVMNPSASSYQLNSMSIPVPSWPASNFSAGPVSYDERTYRHQKQDELQKNEAFYHNETRDSSNTIGGQGLPTVQRQYHDLNSAASPYSSDINYANKGYRSEKPPSSSPSFAMHLTSPHHFFQQQQQQNPLYSRTSTFGHAAPSMGVTTNESNVGVAMSASAPNSSHLKYGSTPHLYSQEGLTFGDFSGPPGDDTAFGYDRRNNNVDAGLYNPYTLDGTLPQPQHLPSQFGTAGEAFYGQQQFHPSAARFDYDEGGRFVDSMGQNVTASAVGSNNGNHDAFGGASTYKTSNSSATLNAVQESRTNVKCPWGRYGYMQSVQEDMGIVSEGSTEASSSFVSSADASGGLDALWHSGVGNIHQGASGAAYVRRGGVMADASFRQDLSLPLHSGLNSRSFSESTNTSVSGGKIRNAQSFVSSNGSSGQLNSTSPPFSSKKDYIATAVAGNAKKNNRTAKIAKNNP